MSENTMVTIGEDEFDLAALAGVDMSEVKEVRSTATPAGKYQWRVVDAVLEARDATNPDDPTGPKLKKPVVAFELKSENCFSLVDPDLDTEDGVGITHRETFWINNVKKDLGRVKAMLVDMGVEGNKPLQELLNESHGMDFVSDVTNVKDKNNPDFIYANLKNIMTLEEFAETQSE